MKNWMVWMIGVVAALALGAGCAAKHKVDTTKLTQGFASAPAPLKAQAETAVKAIEAGNLPEAVAVMSKMAEGQLSAEQKQAILDTLVDVHVIASQKPPADADAFFQTIQDLQTKLM